MSIEAYFNQIRQLIFRYDDTDHHRKLKLPTHPHHKHDASEENIIESSAPTLAEVLEEAVTSVGNAG